MFSLLFQKSLRNLNHKQYGLTYIAHLENIDQLLSKAHMANSNQDKIRIKHIVLSRIFHIYPLKALFSYLEYFWKIFNQGQYRLIHNAHLVNFDQSLLNSHIVQSMLTFAMFVANSDRVNLWTMLVNEPYCPFKYST